MDKFTDDERAAIAAYEARHPRQEKRTRAKPRRPQSYPDRMAPEREPADQRRRPPARPTYRLPSEMSAVEALDWAFRREKVRLELPDRRDAHERAYGFGMEHVLLQRARLGGVRIDTSIGRSEPHEDAETIAAILANLPDALGGKRMAIQVAELARAGRQPDWMQDAEPRIEPVAWNAKGMAKTEVFETIRVPTLMRNGKRGAMTVSRKVDIRYCPCRIVPDQAQISAARNAYTKWWMAVDRFRVDVKASGMLKAFAVTEAMPPAAPWRR